MATGDAARASDSSPSSSVHYCCCGGCAIKTLCFLFSRARSGARAGAGDARVRRVSAVAAPSSPSLSGISRPPSLPGQRPVALSCTPETPCFLVLHAAVGGPPPRRRQHGRGAGLGVAWKPWNVGGEAALRPILVLLDPRASPALPVGGTVHTVHPVHTVQDGTGAARPSSGWVVSSVLTQSSSTCVPRTTYRAMARRIHTTRRADVPFVCRAPEAPESHLWVIRPQRPGPLRPVWAADGPPRAST